MIGGVIFDFDGLILDTETPIFQSWQELYARFGLELTLEKWCVSIGTMELLFDPVEDLHKQLGYRRITEEHLAARARREGELIQSQAIMPGVAALLAEGRKTALKLGVASSSPRDWVIGHLKRLGLCHFFDSIRTQDDVILTKPDPELYLMTLRDLDLKPGQAFALEDSPNGVLAARRAGLFCIAVPNLLTRNLSLHEANLQLDSLEGVRINTLLEQVQIVGGFS